MTGVKFKPVSEAVISQGSKMGVFGSAGSGKTFLCSTTGEPTLMISAEAGLLSIKAAGHIQVYEVDSLEGVRIVYEHVRDNPDDFKWVCLDSISEIAERSLEADLRATKDPRKAYGEMAIKMTQVVKSFRDLPGTNVVFTAKLDREKDDATGSMLYAPGAPGRQLGAQLPYYLDLIAALRVIPDQEGKLNRWLQTGQDAQWLCKDRSGKLDMWEEPNLATLQKKILGVKTTRKAA